MVSFLMVSLLIMLSIILIVSTRLIFLYPGIINESKKAIFSLGWSNKRLLFPSSKAKI